MWKKNLLSNIRRRRSRHKYAQNASKSPSLETIPEDSTLSHSSQVGSFSDNRHRPRIKARGGPLRICFLIFLPVYIITTSLLIRALHRYDIGQTLESLTSSSNRINRGTQQKQTLLRQTMAVGRVVYLDSKHNLKIDRLSRNLIESITMQDDNQSQDEEMSSQNDNQSQDGESPYQQFNTKNDSCEPMAKWQSMSFPTCNSLHEMNVFSTTPYLALRSASTISKFRARRTTIAQHNIIQDTYSAKHVGNGWFRDA